mmetsp:Transcript_18707/g.40511  ORF Transcript_18707/g.40511 Transcript_18707/m.40511 type:complete len:95 (+) Transcript_18707:1317-1601(+)
MAYSETLMIAIMSMKRTRWLICYSQCLQFLLSTQPNERRKIFFRETREREIMQSRRCEKIKRIDFVDSRTSKYEQLFNDNVQDGMDRGAEIEWR